MSTQTQTGATPRPRPVLLSITGDSDRESLRAFLEAESLTNHIEFHCFLSDGSRLLLLCGIGADDALPDHLLKSVPGARFSRQPVPADSLEVLWRSPARSLEGSDLTTRLSDLLSASEVSESEDGRFVVVRGAGLPEAVRTHSESLARLGLAPLWEPRQEVYRVTGMTCSSCVRGIETQVSLQRGVVSVEVSLLTEKAVVRYLPFRVSSHQIVDAIEAIGFEALSLGEISSSSAKEFKCHLLLSQSTENLLSFDMKDMKGVQSLSLDVARQVLVVQYDPELLQPRQLSHELQRLGYRHDFNIPTSTESRSESQSWQQLLWITLLFSAPLLILHVLMLVSPAVDHFLMVPRLLGISLSGYIGFVLATPVQFYSGRRFYVATYKGLRHCSIGMDFLVTCGTSLTWLSSVILMVVQATSKAKDTEYFFETTSTLLMFVILGRVLESRAKKQTASGLESLLSYHPKKAILLLPEGGEESEIPVELIQQNDLLKVVPGDLIPADGVIETGMSNIDQSIITGESVPVTKGPSDFVYGGTTCCDGLLTLRVSTLDNDSTLSHITRFIEQAQSSKPPIQRVADTISSYFGVAVLSLSVLVFIVWYSLCSVGRVPSAWYSQSGSLLFSCLFSISVLVIACPCALGLATPTAIMVGTGLGAKYGILIKNGAALETSSHVDTIVMDKTGTITRGKPSVVEFRLFVEDLSESEFFRRIGSVEKGSDHPLATGIVRFLASIPDSEPQIDYCNLRGIALNAPDSVQSVIGSGLVGLVGGQEVCIGTRSFLERDRSIAIPAEATACCAEWMGGGRTVLFCSVSGGFAGLVGLSDVLKAEVRGTMSYLSSHGYDLHLCSGDTLVTVEQVARQAGIAHFVGAVSPQQKAEYIRGLQSSGRRVVFIGDGVNDSPAIVQADLGLSVSQGTDIAIEVAQIILMKGDLRDLATAIDLSKKVYRKIKMNFAWALIYNVLAIPAASGVLFPWTHARVPPAIAGLLMALSSISVVLSSLALRLYRPPQIE